jgi:hypothetical protein
MKAGFTMVSGLMAAVVAAGGLAVLAGRPEARSAKPCPKGWVMGPQGCQPGSFTAKPKGGIKAKQKPGSAGRVP